LQGEAIVGLIIDADITFEFENDIGYRASSIAKRTGDMRARQKRSGKAAEISTEPGSTTIRAPTVTQL